MRHAPAVLIFTCLALGLPAGAGAQMAARRVMLRAEDGQVLAAAYSAAPERPAPAVILVHMLGRSGRDWEEVARRLAEAGIAALTLDLRGHGRSPGTGGDLKALVADVDAARRFLQVRPDVLGDRIGIAGASLGASLAALVAAAQPAIRSLALLSPVLDYRGLRIEQAMRTYGERPALLVSSSEDAYAYRSVRELATLGGGLREVLGLERSGHGTVMLARSGGLTGALVDWFQRTLL